MTHPRNLLVALGMALVLLTLWCASILAQLSVDREMALYHESPEMLWITSGKVLRVLSMGQQSLLADVYWTRTVQYYGSRLRDHKTDFSLLYPLLDITITLDPRLMVAYYFGAVFLSEKEPRGAGDPQKAIELLQRGIAANPDEWRLWHHLGFIYYWQLHDYAKASAAYNEGAKNPKARDWMKVMAAVITEKGGNRETSLYLWSRIYDSTDDPSIRANANGHIQALRAQNDLEELERLARKFREQTSRWPNSISEMVSQGLLKGVPQDPAGFRYRMLPEGKVALDPASTVRPEFDTSPAPPPAVRP